VGSLAHLLKNRFYIGEITYRGEVRSGEDEPILMSRAAKTAPTKSSPIIAAAIGAEREAELLPTPYYHVVFTLPAAIGDIAYHNKAVIYDLMFKASAETMITIAADPKHLGARIGVTSVLHTWGSALTHHPHVHMIVPGGGISLDGQRWVSCRPGFFLPVRVLSRLFRRLFLEKLVATHAAGLLQFFGARANLADRDAFAEYLTPSRGVEWVVSRQQRAAALGSPSLPPVRASMDCLIKVTVCTRPFRTDGPRHNSSGL
jgi:Putative transposase